MNMQLKKEKETIRNQNDCSVIIRFDLAINSDQLKDIKQTIVDNAIEFKCIRSLEIIVHIRCRHVVMIFTRSIDNACSFVVYNYCLGVYSKRRMF